MSKNSNKNIKNKSGKFKKTGSNFGFRASKALGQNFLEDEEVISRIINGADISADDIVIEIGPGQGALTGRLIKKARKVICVELDNRLIPILHKRFDKYGNIEIINADILDIDLKTLISQEGKREAKIIGNLPYYITTPIIMHVLETEAPVESITIMTQKEVAERILAEPGSRTYGALSVAVQYRCDVKHITDVSREAFQPAPNVDSAVIKLTVRQKNKYKPKNEALFKACVRKAFALRRKQLKNSLASMPTFTKEEVEDALLNTNIDERRRAETLSILEFIRLADALYDIDAEKITGNKENL